MPETPAESSTVRQNNKDTWEITAVDLRQLTVPASESTL